MGKCLFNMLSVSITAFIFSFCKQNDTKNTLTIRWEDYQTVIKAYPDAEGHFIKAQYELKDKLSDISTSKIKVSKVKYIYYLDLIHRRNKICYATLSDDNI